MKNIQSFILTIVDRSHEMFNNLFGMLKYILLNVSVE